MTSESQRQARLGVAYGLAAYGLWGVFPLYFAALNRAGVNAQEILLHRIWWSALLLVVIITAQRRWKELFGDLQSRRTLWTLVASTLLISTNWLTFLIAMETNRKTEASLGYFLTPLMNVLLGVTILRERLRPAQLVSVLIAGAGVLVMTSESGKLPWIALLLAVTFAFYGLCRKTVAVDSVMGLAIETLLLAPLAGGALLWLYTTQGIAPRDTVTWTLLLLSGVATATPLLCFASAARRLRFVTIGFLQYLGPTIQFLLAVLVFKEPLTERRVACFGLIWIAIAVYSFDTLWSARFAPAAKAPMPLEDL
jgi:chloramphenicol-sensitive protein RarD